MTSAEEIRDAAYKLLLSRTDGYYDIQELEDDLRIHLKLSITTFRATLRVHGFTSLGRLLREMLGSDKLWVKKSASTLGSDERNTSHYHGVPDRERFEPWRKQREAEDAVLEGNIRDSRQTTGFQQDGVLEDIHYVLLKNDNGIDWVAELKRLSINDDRREISLHELLKNYMRGRVHIHFRNLVAIHYAAKPIDALTLQQWKHYRRLEEERVYSQLFGEERSFSQASTAPERSHSAFTETLVPPPNASFRLHQNRPSRRPPSVVAMASTPPQPPQRDEWAYLANNLGPGRLSKPSGSHFSFRTYEAASLGSNSANRSSLSSAASDSGRSSVASFDSTTTSEASTQNSRPGSVLSSILRQNRAESQRSPEQSKHRVVLPEAFEKLAEIARNTRNGEIDEGALQKLEAKYGTSTIRDVVKSTPETLEQWREWIRHYGWMLLAQTSIEKTTLLMYNARIERTPPTPNAQFRYRIRFPHNFKHNERLDSMAAIQVCRPGHDPSNSDAKVASVEQVHPRNNFMYVYSNSGPLPANAQWVDVFSMSSTLLPDGILNAATRLTDCERALLYPNFLPKESLQEFIGRREIGLSRMQHNDLLNVDQKRAVFSMLYNAYPEHPFVLRGPPGTGKSETAIELIKETLRAGNKVLLCAQSSVPVENMAKRCLEAGIPPKQVLYLQARGNPVEKRDRALDGIVYVRYKVYCYKGGRMQEVPDEGVGINPQREQKGSQPVFVMPALGIMMHYNLVICTTSITSHLVKAGVPKDHFSYVIVEDAGKVTEPELAMVVTGLKGPRAKLVLVGDPNLSGPVVRPSVLQKSAYEVSTFKRLTNCHGYASGNPDPRLTATLTVNYRNAHTILKLARPFYGNLQRGGRPRTTEWLHHLKECRVLPETFNVVFFDAQTYVNSSARLKPAQQQCGMNASQSNKAEAVAVYKMLCLLLAVERQDGSYLFGEDDIGVIVPYKNQVTMLQRMVQSTFSKVAVDTIQRYQGTQKRVIIVSTTRTNGLGVLKSRELYTSAVMRAMDLLIVIGDRATLSGRKCPWRGVIELCEEHGTVMPHFDPSVDGWLDEQAQQVLRDYVDVVVP